MSKGLSYLAAYRMAQADQMNMAYKQALMEIQNDQARAQAYQDTITSIDKQIEAYEKLLQKVQEPDKDKASKNEILDAEIALANVYSKNAGHSVSVYRYADENFDAPPRVSNEIQLLGQQRSPYYTSGQLGNLNTHLQKPEYANVFTDLSPQQAQDAAIKLFDQVVMEAEVGLQRPLTEQEKRSITSSISSVSNVPIGQMSRQSHQQAKQAYIQNAIDQTQGSTARLERAIAEAKSAGPTTQSTTAPNLTNTEKALVEAASVIAADGVVDESDQAILFSVLSGIYTGPVQIINAEGKVQRFDSVDEMNNMERALLMEQNNLPSSVEELFRQKIVTQSPQVQEARQVGRINRNITILQEEREQLAIARSQAQQDVMEGLTPENLRERQAEIFAQTLSPEERKKYLTPEQMKRIEFLETTATTRAQRKMEEPAVDPLAGMTQDEINIKRAMAAAVLAREQGKEIKLNPTEEDSYRALADLVKNGSIAKQDIYKRSMQLASQMGGLPEARRSFAQSVASRIYLDLYDDQKALQASTEMVEDLAKNKKGKDKLNLTTDEPQPTELQPDEVRFQ